MHAQLNKDRKCDIVSVQSDADQAFIHMAYMLIVSPVEEKSFLPNVLMDQDVLKQERKIEICADVSERDPSLIKAPLQVVLSTSMGVPGFDCRQSV